MNKQDFKRFIIIGLIFVAILDGLTIIDWIKSPVSNSFEFEILRKYRIQENREFTLSILLHFILGVFIAVVVVNVYHFWDRVIKRIKQFNEQNKFKEQHKSFWRKPLLENKPYLKWGLLGGFAIMILEMFSTSFTSIRTAIIGFIGGAFWSIIIVAIYRVSQRIFKKNKQS